jgi:hypothetical protein
MAQQSKKAKTGTPQTPSGGKAAIPVSAAQTYVPGNPGMYNTAPKAAKKTAKAPVKPVMKQYPRAKK